MRMVGASWCKPSVPQMGPRWSTIMITFAILLLLHSSSSTAAIAACTVLNDCARLGEKTYAGTSASPETIVYSDWTLAFANGLSTVGKKFAFSPDVNPNNSYTGVWRVKKGTDMYVRLRNAHPTLSVNLHTHGLHVKGSGSDDPSVQIAPGANHTYKFQVGRNHAGGTHWIHSHFDGTGVINIGGGALGMLILEDDELDREVPPEVRQAEYFNLIIQQHQPKYWDPPNLVAKDFYSVNALSNNPALNVRQGKWIRLRMLSTSVSFGSIVSSQWSLSSGILCDVVLLAKDGVYLKTPRVVKAPYTMWWNEASRVDVMVRCEGDIGSEAQVVFAGAKLFRIRLTERNGNEQADNYEIYYQACLPDYLAGDTSLEPVVNANPYWLDALMVFRGFTPDKAVATFTVGSTVQFNLVGFGHPFHLHINHFQLQNDDLNGWYKKGDWHDTAQNALVRMRLNRWTEMMLVHCHNIVHQETIKGVPGMMALMWINGTDKGDTAFGDSCANRVVLLPATREPTFARPSQVPSTSFPSKAPSTSFPSKAPRTSFPSKSPSINVKCLGYDQDICPLDRCYFHQPDELLVTAAIQKLPKKSQKACLSQLGCRPKTPEKLFCNYKCMPLCPLDPLCEVRTVKGKKVCKPKPV